MHHIPLLITDLALILTVAVAATIICRKLKQPLVLGYVVAGFLIGPAVGWFPNVADSEGISTWSEIGVIFLMFGLGLEFSIVRLLNVGKAAVITAVTEMALMIAAGMLCGTALGWSFFSSLFLGGMLAISSTTIIIKAFDDLGLKGKKFTELVFGSLVVEDIMGIFMMVVLSTMAVSASLDGGAVVVELGQMALYLVAWFALSVIFVPSLLSRVAHIVSDEILLVASLALCLCMVALANAIGFSSALGAFLAGSILAGTAQAHRIENLFKSVKDLFGAVFFVSVGMLLSPDAVIQNAPAIVAITLVTLLGKPVFTFLGAMLSGQSLKTSVKCGMSLSQIGEFSFIIAALGASLGVTDDFLYPIIVAVSVITTLTTPVYVKNSDKLYRALAKILPGRILERIDSSDDESGGGEGSSSLWANHAKRWTLKVVLVVLSATASVEVLKKVIEPLLATAIPNEALNWTVMVICVIITGLFMSNVFHADRTTEFNVLWMKDKRNHVPLTALTIVGAVICVGMVFFIVNASGVGQSPIPYLIALVVTGVMAVSKRIHSLFIRLETSFIGNLNENIIAERRDALSDEERETWVKRNLYVVEIEATRMLHRREAIPPLGLSPLKSLAGTPSAKQLSHGEQSADFMYGLAYGLDLIAIQRGDRRIECSTLARLTKSELARRIIDPSDPLCIQEGDVLTFLGTEDEADAYLQSLVADGTLDEGQAYSISLDEYLGGRPAIPDATCFAIDVDASSPLAGTTIAVSQLKERYGSLVVALRHNWMLKLRPQHNMRISAGDRIWLMGKADLADPLIKREDATVLE